MSCWFLIKNSNEVLDGKINRFKRIFSSASGYNLNIEEKKINGDTSLVLWSWNDLKIFPDISYFFDSLSNIHVMLDGFISDFGKFGNAEVDKIANVKKAASHYKNDKTDFIKELNGSFSLIILDENSKEINLYNDRTSTRPIWYNSENQTFYAANFPSAIIPLKKEKIKFNEIGLWSFLAAGRHIGDLGIFEGVKILRSGSVLKLNNNNINISNWFNFKYKPNYNLNINEWGERVAAELRQSAKKIFKNYKNVNLFLSGGMDSRVAAASFGNKASSVTITTRDNMNSKISGRVARTIGMQHKTIYRFSNWYLFSFASSALIASGNYKLTHAHFTPIFKENENYFNQTFVLGDLLENFNKHYFKIPVSNLTTEDFVKNYTKIYSYSLKDFDEFENVFADNYGKKIRKQWEGYLFEEAKQIEKVSEFKEDFADAFFRWQNNTVCPTYLMLESITPFANLINLMFDNVLIDTLLSIPHEIKKSGKLHNQILRNLNSKLLLIPNSNFWMPPIVPDVAANYAKKIRPVVGRLRRKLKMSKNKEGPLILTEGSWDMLHERYRKDENYKNEVKTVLLENSPINFNYKIIEERLDNFMKGCMNIDEIDHLYSFKKLCSMLRIEG